MQATVRLVVLAVALGMVMIFVSKSEERTERLLATAPVMTAEAGPTATRRPQSAVGTTSAGDADAALTVTATATPWTRAERTEQDAASGGLWLSPQEVASLPMGGDAWKQLLAVAGAPPDEPDVYDKDDDGDVYVLARALVYARTAEPQYRVAVLHALQQVMAQESNPRRTSILSVARNLPAYVIAADLVNLAQDPVLDGQFRDWLRDVRDTRFSGDGGSHTIGSCHETRPNNFGSHCGAARLAIALYLQDDQEVARAANVFHGWLGNREAYDDFQYGRLSWQADPDEPVAINPPGTMKEGRPIGGALPEEMRRGGDFRWPPKRTGYVWEALQGAIVQAELLARAGYAAWEWEDRALLRAVEYLYELGWEPNGDDTWQPWLINYAYGTDFPATTPVRPGKNMGWTDWTHGSQRASGRSTIPLSGGSE